ncbi:17612_t:CDS:2, partial [Acaulospora morrowiae]
MDPTAIHRESFTSTPVAHQFYPYADNGGSSLAIAGEDFCVLASDTRQ